MVNTKLVVPAHQLQDPGNRKKVPTPPRNRSSISLSDVTPLSGADMPQLLIREQYKARKENDPFAVRAKLGWVLMGGKSGKLEKSVTNNVCLVHSIDEINLKQFWNIENYGILSKNDSKMLTRDEARAMSILETTTTLKK